MMAKYREFTEYIAPDGTVYKFHIPSRIGRWVVSESGWGTPPIEYITQRGPYQDGETVTDFFLRPRAVQLLIRNQYCNREDYWAGRAGILDSIRPNRQTTPTAANPGTLRLVLPDGSLRDLHVFIESGPQFEPRRAGFWDEHAFQEVLRFVAYDPVIFDPVQVGLIFGFGFTELTFPIKFYESV